MAARRLYASSITADDAMKGLFWRLPIFGVVVFLSTAVTIGLIGLHDRLGKADMAVVLGAFVESNGQPSARLHARLEKAAELYKKGFFSTILVSAGAENKWFDEAAIMKADLQRSGIPSQNIWIDSGGTTTYLTAKNTARLMREKNMQSVFIFSQFFHLPRARLAFHQCGVPSVYYAHAHYFEWRDLYSLGREVFAIYYYLLRGYSTNLG